MIAKEYYVPASTLSTWIKTKDSILKTEIGAPTRKRIRSAKHTDVETTLLMWFKNVPLKQLPGLWTDVTGESRRLGQRSWCI